MAGPGSIGIVLDLDASGAIAGARVLGDGLDRLRKASLGAGDGIEDLGGRTNDLQQQIANVLQGLDSLESRVSGMAVWITEILSTTEEAYKVYEMSLARIDIAIGRVGKNFSRGDLVNQAEEIEEVVRRIGKETEFTMTDAADAFVNLSTAGLTAAQSLGIIDSVMAFSSASAGTLSLTDAADTLVSAQTALGIKTDELVPKLNHLVDVMVKGGMVSKLQMEDWGAALRSMGASAMAFDQSKPEEFLALLAVLKQMGRGAAQAGHDMNGLSRSIGRVMDALSTGKMKGKKGAAWEALRFDKSDFKDQAGNLHSILDLFERVIFRIRDARKMGMTSDVVASHLRSLFGGQQAQTLFMLADQYLQQYGSTFNKTLQDELGLKTVDVFDKLGKTLDGETEKRHKAIGGSLFDMFGLIDNAEGAALDSQARAMMTLTGAQMLASGSLEQLTVDIGELNSTVRTFEYRVQDLILSGLDEWVAENSTLAFSLTVLLNATKYLLYALAASLGVMAAFQGLLMATGTTLQFTAAGTVNWAASLALLRANLASFLWVAWPVLAKFAFILGVGVLLVEGYNAGFMDLRYHVEAFGSSLKKAWSLMGLLFSKGGIPIEEWEALDKSTQSVLRSISVLYVKFRDLLRAMSVGFQDGSRIVVLSLLPVVWVVVFLSSVFSILLDLLGVMSTHTEDVANGWSQVGYVLGMVLAFSLGVHLIWWALVKPIVLIAGLAMNIGTAWAATRLFLATRVWPILLVIGRWFAWLPGILMRGVGLVRAIGAGLWVWAGALRTAIVGALQSVWGLLSRSVVLLSQGVVFLARWAATLASGVVHGMSQLAFWLGQSAVQMGILSARWATWLSMQVVSFLAQIPFLLLAAALAVVVAGLILLSAYWDDLTAYLETVTGLTGALNYVLAGLVVVLGLVALAVGAASVPIWLLVAIVGLAAILIYQNASKIWHALSDMAWQIGNFFWQIGVAIATWAVSAGSWGASFVTNLIEGIKSKWTDLKDAVKEMLGLTVRDQVETHSPARAGPLHEVSPNRMGELLVQNVAKGVRQGSPLMHEAVGSLVSAAPLAAAGQSASEALGLSPWTARYLASAPESARAVDPYSRERYAPISTSPQSQASPMRAGPKTVNVNVNLSVDMRLAPQNLSEAEARRWAGYVATQLRDQIEDEFRASSLT